MKKAVLILLLTFPGGAAFAGGTATASRPVEISAARSLEWNRKEKTYTAREKVIVVQGAARIQSDILTARYTDDAGATDFSTLEASQHVIIQSPPYTATGDRAVYNVKTGNATLTGHAMKVTTGEDRMTALDKIEFFGAEDRLTATGKATVTRGPDIMTADVLNVYFGRDATGKMTAEKATAAGNVIIKTARETITGDEGVYDILAQKSVLSGKVRIRQGENWLEGTTANIDMTTGISQLLGGGNAGTEGRVKGVFYPRDKNQDPEGQKN